MPDDLHLRTVSAELSSLLHRAADGDERAFASLYDATAPRVFGLAFRMLGDWETEAFLQLSPNQRECIEMAYLGGHTHGEVAGLLDARTATVKAHLRTGLLRLKELV